MQIDVAVFIEPTPNDVALVRIVGAINLLHLPYKSESLAFMVRAVFEPEECDQSWRFSVIVRDPENRVVMSGVPNEGMPARDPFDARGYVIKVLDLTDVWFSEQGVYVAELQIASLDKTYSHTTCLPVRVNRS